MMREPTTACVECGKAGRSAYRFRTATPEVRQQWHAEGIRRIEARGLCQPCYRRATRAGTLNDYERRNRPRDEILEDWLHLADPTVHVLHECRRLAPQFGMDAEALERAVYRAGIRSRLESGHGERMKRTAA